MSVSIKVKVVILLVLPVLTFARQIDNKVGTVGFQFLKLGVGAREVALGGANTAIPEGPTAIYWNPAGICLDNQKSATFFNNSWIANINHNFIGFKTPVSGNDFIGASVNFITMDDMEETTIIEPQGTGRKFTSSDLAFTATYGRKITDRFGAAISVKYINETIWGLVSDGWAFDMGFVYNYNKFHVGMSFNNFGLDKQISGDQLQLEYQIFPDYKTDEVLLEVVPDDIRLPTSFRFGAGFDILKMNYHKLTVMASLNYFNDIGQNGSAGLEYKFMENYILRGGYQFNHEGFDWSVGAGVRFHIYNTSFEFGYATMNLRDFGLQSQTSLTISF